jgi:serine phosphatase RsbU (regulator of sigma subunit)/DNA-binding transcriptional regulator YhcF (GntR family)
MPGPSASTETRPGVQSQRYALRAEDESSLSELLKSYRGVAWKSQGALLVAVRRRGLGADRSIAEDKLIDYCISLEALFGKKDEKNEISFRLDLGGAWFLSETQRSASDAREGAKMNFNPVNKKSGRSVHQQLREQIISRITTGELQVGDELPSVRTVARHLGISVNTVSSVYRELVVERWLVERPGSQHIVINRIRDDALKTQFEGPDELVDQTIKLALKNGYPLQHVVSLLHERLLDQPPDHLVVVEPEAGLGQLMREEIRQEVGFAPAGCSVAALKQDPRRSIGAVLLTPIHLQDLLDFIPPAKRHSVTLFFSSPDRYAKLIRDLPHPSTVGMVSISPGALKTFSDNLAGALGERHTSHAFLMEWPVDKTGPRFRHFSKYEPIPIRKPTEGSVQSDKPSMVARSDSAHRKEDEGELRFSGDLDFVDILLCDSIAYKVVKHRRSVPCRLLSNESLEAVAARSESLRRDLAEYQAERRAASAKLEAERRAAQEIAIAKQVQEGLFPRARPQLRTLEYAGKCIQARHVGGDYYDFLNLGHERLALVVGDIVGKGIAAALLMANLQASLRSQCAIAVNQPQRMLQSVNQHFYENTAESAYATLFFAEYDDHSRRLRYANCGNLPALLLRGDNSVERLESTTTVLGLFEEFDSAMAELPLCSGDTLALYTDGITESCSPDGEEFGEKRLAESLQRRRHLPAEALVSAVVEELKQFSPGEQNDDITLIVAHCGERRAT